MGGVGFVLASAFTLPEILESIRGGNPLFALGFLVVFCIGGGMMLLFIAMGLFTITTEIDLSTRKVRITKRNIRGASATSEASLDDLRISAVRMGVSDSAPHGAWIVRAGFQFEGEDGEDNSVAIWSKEVSKEQNVKERNDIMFELYNFFFPNRPPVNENNIITNGTVVMLLSNSEKEEFLSREVVFEKREDDGVKN